MQGLSYDYERVLPFVTGFGFFIVLDNRLGLSGNICSFRDVRQNYLKEKKGH